MFNDFKKRAKEIIAEEDKKYEKDREFYDSLKTMNGDEQLKAVQNRLEKTKEGMSKGDIIKVGLAWTFFIIVFIVLFCLLIF